MFKKVVQKTRNFNSIMAFNDDAQSWPKLVPGLESNHVPTCVFPMCFGNIEYVPRDASNIMPVQKVK